MIDNAADRPAIAYVLTHYPRVALSFITGEIDVLEQRGFRIHPMAMNAPDPADLVAPGSEERRSRTVYLKSGWSRAIADFVRVLARSPVATTKLFARALASARLDLGLMARRVSHLLQAASAARYCEAAGIGHLHAHFGQAPATIAWFAAEILNFRASERRASWSFTIHGFQDFVDETVARLDLKARHAAFVICISDFTRSQLFRVSDPECWHRAHVVRCGVNLATFPFRGQRGLARPVRLVCVGRLSAEKGQLTLLHACGLLAKDGLEFQLTFVGAGPLEPQIRREVERLGLGSRVELPGEMTADKVRQELEESDIFCMASFSEGLPVSIMEAMAVGVPVVCTGIAGIPELAIHGQTALAVPPANAEALAGAIAELVRDDALRQRIVVAARERVEKMHGLEGNVELLGELFRRQLDTPPPALAKEMP